MVKKTGLLGEIDEAIKTLKSQEGKGQSYSFEHGILVLLKAVSQLLENDAAIRQELRRRT